MARAIWNGVVLAESDDIKLIEGNVYFPPDAINREYFRESSHHTHCFWKGEASYYTIEVNGQRNADAAWYYPRASFAAKMIEGRVAFWHGITVER
jgi:uncharacterized protein (DUF427 family)